jgi:8-oxo-dGTP pyrophosphatase MutT (NUDIX family)
LITLYKADVVKDDNMAAPTRHHRYPSKTVCSNCGGHGHFFRECSEPITSYGLIAFRVPDPSFCLGQAVAAPDVSAPLGNPETPIEYLMIRRRDSLSFVEFMRGKYSLDRGDYIFELVKGMTAEEHRRLTTVPFDELWGQLWSGPLSRSYRNEYDVSYTLWLGLTTVGTRVQGRDRLCKLRDMIDMVGGTAWSSPEWGFPKGRRNARENDMACAVREFEEETGLRSNAFTVLRNLAPFDETFVGSNGVTYRHRYFLAMCNWDCHVSVRDTDAVQKREVGDIGWFTLDKTTALLRPSDETRKDVLRRVETMLRSYTPLIVKPGSAICVS